MIKRCLNLYAETTNLQNQQTIEKISLSSSCGIPRDRPGYRRRVGATVGKFPTRLWKLNFHGLAETARLSRICIISFLRPVFARRSALTPPSRVSVFRPLISTRRVGGRACIRNASVELQSGAGSEGAFDMRRTLTRFRNSELLRWPRI